MKNTSLRTAFVALGVALPGAWLLWRLASRRWQLPCPPWLAWMLENPFMEAISSAEVTLHRIGLQPGERGLDIGCGPGRVSLPASRRVGPSGEIVALDIQPEMLARLQERITNTHITNISPILGDITTGASLPSGHFDRAWLVTVLGEIPDQQAALKHIYRVLKPGGTLSITEVLPDPHYQTRATVLKLGQEAGFAPGPYWGSALAFTQNLIRLP